MWTTVFPFCLIVSAWSLMTMPVVFGVFLPWYLIPLAIPAGGIALFYLCFALAIITDCVTDFVADLFGRVVNRATPRR